ncbi:hypothetical protein RHGRI_037709 [Rhododendron griersonianum]|uniref:Fe2OG dioxygenase domain-containing protein n=1 Tax=Rhododendron griersonianum TaxID=479676 RepID=A0AAV6HTC0_9ERIC|nr:hypothetical protein RHGRI_037709 [Rhododendron griersonianum]
MQATLLQLLLVEAVSEHFDPHFSSGILGMGKLVHKTFPGSSFNSLLLNRYKGGNDYVGWHADDDKLYGSTPEIVSVSFGCDREFLLRKKPSKIPQGCAMEMEVDKEEGAMYVVVSEPKSQQEITHHSIFSLAVQSITCSRRKVRASDYGRDIYDINSRTGLLCTDVVVWWWRFGLGWCGGGSDSGVVREKNGENGGGNGGGVLGGFQNWS